MKKKSFGLSLGAVLVLVGVFVEAEEACGGAK